MDIKNFLYRHSNISSESEHRLVCFAGGVENRNERLDKAQKMIAEERQRRFDQTGNLSDRLNPNRVSAAAVDEERSGALRDAERQALLMGDTPESRRYAGALKKTQKLEQIFASQGKIEGVQYGFAGADFTIVAADEQFVEWALKYIVAQQKELQAPVDDPTVEHAFNPVRETKQDFNRRMDALRADNKQYEGNLRQRNTAEIDEWKMVLSALEKYQSTFAAAQRFTKEVAANPRRILDAPPSFKRDNPKQYKQLLRNAAAADPSILRGIDVDGMNPADMTAKEFAAMVKEANTGNKETGRKGNPLVLQYLPETEKEKDGGKEYRALMVEGAKINGTVLRIAGKEYDKYWKGAEDQYKELCVNALNQEPALFVSAFNYLRPESVNDFRNIVARLNPETKLALVKTVYDTSRFSRLDQGYAGFIESQIAGPGASKANEVLIAVGRRDFLWNAIQGQDPTLHARLRTMIQDSEDPNVRALLEIPYIGGNEKIGVSVLLKLAGDISAIGADIDGIARNRGRELATLPSHVWNDPRYEAQFLAVFKAQGELFQYAPRAIRNDQPWVMKVMKVNAGAYAHISERMQDDPEVLYRAINSDKRLSGEFYWKNVGPVLKLQLKANGIKGIPSADDLLQVLLGLEKEKPPLTSDTVDSLIGDWTEVQKNDPLRVTRYLQIHRDHPEYFLDVGDKLRSDFTFIGKITKEMPLIFDQLDHEALYRANPKGYIQFAAELYKSGFQLYLKIPDALRNQDAFYTAVVKASRLIKSATSSTPPAKPGKPKPRTPPLE